MGNFRQDRESRKSLAIKQLKVNESNILTIGEGYVYYENSSSDFAQVVITDENDNIQPVIFSDTSEITTKNLSRPIQNISKSNTLP